MKFLALSAIATLGFLAHESQTAFIPNNLQSNFGANNPFQNLPGANSLLSGSSSPFLLDQQVQQPNGFDRLNQFSNINQNPLNNMNQNQNPFNNSPPQIPLIEFNYNQNGFNNNLSDHNQVCSETLNLRSIKRSIDGTQNNLKNTRWGATGSGLQRLCSPNYQDGKSIVWSNIPQPREVSNLVGQVQGSIPQSTLGNNMLFTIWGQFLDHDLSLSLPSRGNEAESLNIKIPKCDIHFDKKCTGKQQFNFTRSSNTKSAVRTNINIRTAWIDGGQVYGSDKATADSLREFKSGKMKVSEGNLLPKNQQGQFQAGDFRVDQNVGLTIFHVIFLRQHNRLCDLILKRDSKLSDQDVYQIARHYVIGLLQHITFDEYLPELIGRQNMQNLIGSYRYDEKSNPNIFTEFSAAAFRNGHPLINSPILTSDNSGRVIKAVPLAEMFFNPSLVTVNGVNQFLNGMARTAGKQRSIELIDDVRNFLAFPPVSATIDLFAFNIQRGRDHGICSIKGARQKLGLKDKSIREIFDNQEKAKILEKIYIDADNVDLWLGIIGQKKRSDAVLGELGIKLNVLQFKKIRNGDRFWYEKAYPQSVVKEIKATNFSDVIKRNSGATLINQKTFKKSQSINQPRY